jgi:hypothetical protein
MCTSFAGVCQRSSPMSNCCLLRTCSYTHLSLTSSACTGCLCCRWHKTLSDYFKNYSYTKEKGNPPKKV